jgi:hypothetical protein
MDQEDFEELARIGEYPAGRMQSVLIPATEDSPGPTVSYVYDGVTGALRTVNDNPTFHYINRSFAPELLYDDNGCPDYEADC